MQLLLFRRGGGDLFKGYLLYERLLSPWCNSFSDDGNGGGGNVGTQAESYFSREIERVTLYFTTTSTKDTYVSMDVSDYRRESGVRPQ